MEISMWCKTLVSIYPRLDEVIKAVNKSVEKVIRCASIRYNNPIADIDNIRELLLQKKDLQHAKALVKAVMMKMTEYDVLVARYIHHCSFRKIAEAKNTYPKAAFRQNEAQLSEMSELLMRAGYDGVVCERIWGNNAIFRQVIGELSKGGDREEGCKCYMLYNFVLDADKVPSENKVNTYNPYIAQFV